MSGSMAVEAQVTMHMEVAILVQMGMQLRFEMQSAVIPRMTESLVVKVVSC